MGNFKKNVLFCRRNKGSGIYTGNINGKVIRLVDRAVISPKDPREIKFLMDDPEIEIFATNQDEQKEENARNANKDRNTSPSQTLPPKRD